MSLDRTLDATAYDHPLVQGPFVRRPDRELREVSLIIEGISCGGCVARIERGIRSLPGVQKADLNYATRRARVVWNEASLRLSDVLQTIQDLGYQAYPFDPSRQELQLDGERRQRLLQIGIAGLVGMQVMMASIALYAGEWSGMEAGFEDFLRWIAMALTSVVIVYCARPFYAGAARDLKHRRLGMDVPVCLGLTIAFLGSLRATLTGDGPVYYDSVVMFVFFLLVARYLEFAARRRSANAAEAALRDVPAVATRFIANPDDPGGGLVTETVAVADLRPGDHVRVLPGETVPVDGSVLSGHSSVEESLLTGESNPVSKHPGDCVLGGSINIESPLEIEVDRISEQSTLSRITQLARHTLLEKPRVARIADRAATYFVSAVLILALGVALYWWHVDPQRWLPITVAVLVVTCPCALSLATPAALSAATGTLTSLGLVITRSHALEALARVSRIAFDKTGTLTEGRFELLATKICSDLPAETCLARAAALERHSEHPIARALVRAGKECVSLTAIDVINVPGSGLRGWIDGGRYFIGAPRFVAEQTGLDFAGEDAGVGHTTVLLADRTTIYCAFILGDELRTGVAETIAALKRCDVEVSVLSGDNPEAVANAAAATGIDEFAGGLRPDDKLQRLKALQHDGSVVAVVGDGVNDAPFLSGAQVSIAMGGGAQIARASADVLLLDEQLSRIADGVLIARKTLRVIRQNLIWAAAYNLVALPAAAAGFVAPWMAAIGMSLSSLVVVANAMRLRDGKLSAP